MSKTMWTSTLDLCLPSTLHIPSTFASSSPIINPPSSSVSDTLRSLLFSGGGEPVLMGFVSEYPRWLYHRLSITSEIILASERASIERCFLVFGTSGELGRMIQCRINYLATLQTSKKNQIRAGAPRRVAPALNTQQGGCLFPPPKLKT